MATARELGYEVGDIFVPTYSNDGISFFEFKYMTLEDELDSDHPLFIDDTGKSRYWCVDWVKKMVKVETGFEVNTSGGMKETSGKLRWTLLPLLAVKEIVKVLEYGAKKYSADNWKKVEPEKYKEAAFRHWTAYLEGEKVDPETGISHLAHLGCDVLFLLWFELTGNTDEKTTDRL